MDRFSHIALAKGLLKVANERTDMAYLSILPLVDGSPSFLHRLHCHSIVKSPVVVQAAKKVFGTTENVKPNIEDSSFEVVRIKEEKHQFEEAFQTTLVIHGTESMKIDQGFGALLSVLSHTYFDTYNNAVQAFVPYEGYCAGQYEMWKKINDYFSYRVKWYRKTSPQFRIKVLQEDFWNSSFTAKELVKGMIHRIANFTKPSISKETLKKVEIDLGVYNLPSNNQVKAFYESLEKSIEQHLIQGVNSLDEKPHWQGNRTWIPIPI